MATATKTNSVYFVVYASTLTLRQDGEFNSDCYEEQFTTLADAIAAAKQHAATAGDLRVIESTFSPISGAWMLYLDGHTNGRLGLRVNAYRQRAARNEDGTYTAWRLPTE